MIKVSSPPIVTVRLRMCADGIVTPTTLKSVLGQRAYMLFYVKRSLAYAQPMAKMLATNSVNNVSTIATAGTHPSGYKANTGSTVPPPLGLSTGNGITTPKKGFKGLPDKPKTPQSPFMGRVGHPINGMAL